MSKILSKHLIGDSSISYVDAPLTSVPNTSIINRAQIRNPASDMKCHAGIDRIPVQQVVEIPTEFGSSGEKVYGTLNDSRDLIRFVGAWLNNNDSGGIHVYTATANDYAEIVFFGTGLNVLCYHDTTNVDCRATVDGGTEGANFFNTSRASTLSTRNYSQNTVFNVVSGLSLGLHTVKMRYVSGGSPRISAFEILNESTSIRVNPGTIIKDQRRFSLENAQSLSMTPSSLTNGKGGRVVVYNSGARIQTAVQAVDTTAKYLSNADHSNEDVVRIYNWREFGVGRSDDFSAGFANSNKAFTLEDGTTNLVGIGVNSPSAGSFTPNEVLYFQSTSSFITITFVGTGLDVLAMREASASTVMPIYVDGTNIGSLTNSDLPNAQVYYQKKIVSGLPYGTHTVKFAPSTYATANFGFGKFIVYGPKKPSIPSGAVELADYNVMADFVANSTVGTETIATGVLRKSAIREMVYSGAWSVSSVAQSYPTGFEVGAGTFVSGAYLEYTFFGTGFELRGETNGTASNSVSVTLNGLAATTANFSTLVSSVYGYTSFSSGTLNMTGTSNAGAGLRISGLPLGKYTVRFTTNTTSNMWIHCLDVITPIHAPKSNLYTDIMNTLPVGSQSISDSRRIIDGNTVSSKPWVRTIQAAPSSSSSTSYVPVANMNATIKTSGGPVEVKAVINFVHSDTGDVTYGIFVNGAVYSELSTKQSSSNNRALTPVIDTVQLPAGTHRIEIMYKRASGTTTDNGAILTVREL